MHELLCGHNLLCYLNQLSHHSLRGMPLSLPIIHKIPSDLLPLFLFSSNPITPENVSVFFMLPRNVTNV